MTFEDVLPNLCSVLRFYWFMLNVEAVLPNLCRCKLVIDLETIFS